MNDDGAMVFYLPRLDDGDLLQAIRWTFAVYDHAPMLCGWLFDALADEQTRRLASRTGEPHETELLKIPCHIWPTKDLQQALTVANVLSYSTHDYRVGQLVDALVMVLVAAVGARLNNLERRCLQ